MFEGPSPTKLIEKEGMSLHNSEYFVKNSHEPIDTFYYYQICYFSTFNINELFIDAKTKDNTNDYLFLKVYKRRFYILFLYCSLT